jgi:hypothetical protein
MNFQIDVFPHLMKKILALIIILLFLFSLYRIFLYKDILLVNVEGLIYSLKGIEVYGVSGDEDIGISSIIKPAGGLPIGFEGLSPEAFNSSGNIYVFSVGEYYVFVFKSNGNVPISSSVDISKPLGEGGILENPLVSMRDLKNRYHEIEDAFLKIPICPKSSEASSHDGIKFKRCISKRKKECSSNVKFLAYKCMLEGCNQWATVD